MVTLSESNNTECSTTTPHLGSEREHFVSSTNNNLRQFSSPNLTASAASAAAVVSSAASANLHQNPHHGPHAHPGLWDLTNSELGYELAASSGKVL